MHRSNGVYMYKGVQDLNSKLSPKKEIEDCTYIYIYIYTTFWCILYYFCTGTTQESGCFSNSHIPGTLNLAPDWIYPKPRCKGSWSESFSLEHLHLEHWPLPVSLSISKWCLQYNGSVILCYSLYNESKSANLTALPEGNTFHGHVLLFYLVYSHLFQESFTDALCQTNIATNVSTFVTDTTNGNSIWNILKQYIQCLRSFFVLECELSTQNGCLKNGGTLYCCQSS